MDIYCYRAIKINDVLGKIINRPEYYIKNGFIYSFILPIGKFEKVIQEYNMAYDISKNYNLMLLENETLIKFSKVLKSRENYIAVNKSEKLENNLGLIGGYYKNSDFALVYWKNGEYNRAIDFYKKAIAGGIIDGNNLIVSTAASNLSLIYYDMGKYSDALYYSNLSINIAKKMYRFDHYYLKYQEDIQGKILKAFNK